MVLLSAEDTAEDTIRPRLEAAGANFERIIEAPHVAVGERHRPPEIPADLDLIEATIAEHDARLLIIEPLAAYLAGPDANHDQEIRRVLYKLSKIAERQQCAVVTMRHLNKSGGGKAIYRGNMSIGVIGHARVGLLVAEDPDDEAARVLAMVKINCGARQASWRFKLVPAATGEVCRVEWCGVSPYSGDQLVQAPPSQAAKDRQEELQSKVELTKDMLLTFLEDGGGVVTVKEVRDCCAAMQVSGRCLERAVAELGLNVQYAIGKDGKRTYYWSLPKDGGVGGNGT